MRSHHADAAGSADGIDIDIGTAAEVEVELGAAVLADHPLPRHEEGATKRDRGTVLIVGGSAETPGSVVLAGTAALRAGAGRLQIATSAPTAAAVGTAVPEARVIAWADDPRLEAPDGELASALRRADAVLLGTGMLDDLRAEPLLHLAAATVGPEARLLVDAGALGACGDGSSLRGLSDRAALMPNASEAALMLGDDPGRDEEDGPTTLRRLVATQGTTVALRDATTFVGCPSAPGTRWVERSGTPALATSGSGDVLAGVAAGLLARGAEPLTALLWAVHAHARTGCHGSADDGVLARDLLDRVAPVLGELSREVG